MANESAKERLVDLLNRKAFRPVLDASPDRYDTENQKRKLKDVQDATRRERERYREEYTSARDVYDNFKSDLSSDEAKEVERKLRSLDLPALCDVQDEFERLADDLRVSR